MRGSSPREVSAFRQRPFHGLVAVFATIDQSEIHQRPRTLIQGLKLSLVNLVARLSLERLRVDDCLDQNTLVAGLSPDRFHERQLGDDRDVVLEHLRLARADALEISAVRRPCSGHAHTPFDRFTAIIAHAKETKISGPGGPPG